MKKLLKRIKTEQPLIHCITNHISINDCANAVLALGAKPIMAEHPSEVSEITASAKALAINLGNISDSRMQAISVSGETACRLGIPIVIDVVGVSCSKLRFDFAENFINTCKPSVVKGNEAEIRALCGLPFRAKGVDSCENTEENELAELARAAAEKFGSIVLISGKTDAVSDGSRTALVKNGSCLMPYVTGTGCMLNVVCGTFLSAGNPFESAVAAAVTMGLAGEYAEEIFNRTKSISTFHNALIDGLFNIDDYGKARICTYE